MVPPLTGKKKKKKKKAAKNDLSRITNQAVHYASAKLKVFV